MILPFIIYEDNHLLIVQKPPGFLSQPDGGPRPDILSWAERYLARNKAGRAYVGLVHRLDKNVGGVLALAKTSKSAARLSLQFRERTCEKKYLALVTGEVGDDFGRMDDEMIREGSLSRLAGPSEKGKMASLTWKLEKRFAKSHEGLSLALLEINLISGFKHQIRAQLAARQWPIVGDLKYQSPFKPSNQAIGLWAKSLSINHPTKKERMTFTAEAVKIWPWTFLASL